MNIAKNLISLYIPAHMLLRALLLLFFVLFPFSAFAQMHVGSERLFDSEFYPLLKGKKIGLISNQSAINHDLKTTFEKLNENQKDYTLVAIFAPEHGFHGNCYAGEHIEDASLNDVPLFGLHGSRRRPTQEMLAGIDLLIFDIQDIGSRSYTFLSTLFYCMEEAAQHEIPLIVLDRPNPMGGVAVDGPLIDEKWRSFLGYINIPYCHGMTVGELAQLFNQEYEVGCELTIIPMEGWKRGMLFHETGLPWTPTSPQIPESDTSFYFPTTGLIGHCSLVNIGIGYTLPFKLIGAPWIKADQLAEALNAQKMPGVYFRPYYYRPFFGKFKAEECQGVRILVKDFNTFLPVTTQFTIMGVIKNLYPKQYNAAFAHLMSSPGKRETFNKLVGNEEILTILTQEKYIIWKLREICAEGKKKFLPIRKKYLNSAYN